MVSKEHPRHDQLCVGRSTSKTAKKNVVDHYLILCSPFFSLHGDEASLSRSWLSKHLKRGFEDEVFKKKKTSQFL
jgi:hypothetical protein